jgi:hypothetical protein
LEKPPTAFRLFDLLVSIGECLMPPWRRWSRVRKALVGGIAVLVALAVVVSVVWQLGMWVVR